MKKNALRQLALKRVKLLLDRALYINDEFAPEHAKVAKRIILKYKLKIPFEYKILFCKNCKKLIAPGRNSTIRLGRSNTKALRITCKFCGHTYRKILTKKSKGKPNKSEKTIASE
jgi:ribonuclease P protein subunit RPR2